MNWENVAAVKVNETGFNKLGAATIYMMRATAIIIIISDCQENLTNKVCQLK